MAVFTIRKYQRFAVRRAASLHCPKKRHKNGLLVEVSLDGCRLGIAESLNFAVGAVLNLRLDGFDDLKAEVRWSGNGYLGLRFIQALHVADLDRLIRACRPEPVEAERPRAYAI